jgi:hypothetical protein
MADIHLTSLPRLLPCPTAPPSSRSAITSTTSALINTSTSTTTPSSTIPRNPLQYRSRSISSSTTSTPRLNYPPSTRPSPYLRPSPTTRRRRPRHPTTTTTTVDKSVDFVIDRLEHHQLASSRSRHASRLIASRPRTPYRTDRILSPERDHIIPPQRPVQSTMASVPSTSSRSVVGQASTSSSDQHQQVRVKQEEGEENGSAAPVAPVKRMVKDPYHGHEETAKMSARFVSVDDVWGGFQVVGARWLNVGACS